jgi:hypothetical protein
MPFESMREKLRFTPEEIAILVELSRSRTHPLREVERAKILLASVEGMNDSQIARELHTNRYKVIRTIKKALAYGLEDALKDLPRSGRPKVDLTRSTRLDHFYCLHETKRSRVSSRAVDSKTLG